MNYTRDLLKEKKKSTFRVIIGILFFVISIFWIQNIFKAGHSLEPFDWFYSAILLLNGIVHILGGLGYSVERLIGKAYIKINSEFIKVKPGIFEKETEINWNDIDSIDYIPNVFKIHKQDKTTQLLSISKLDYSIISDIKNVISEIAKVKKLHYIVV